MATAAQETVQAPFVAFNFAVEITVPGVSKLVCHAAFSECDGLEVGMDVKTIREGGNNTRQIRLVGPVNLGTLVLKRGMTENADLWSWFGAVYGPSGGAPAATALVVLKGPDGGEKARFALDGCLPVKLKAPALNAREGAIAIEEFQMAYETLSFVASRPPQ
ncbi:MAG: phage tail protein [Verrucomicrobiales bacterium]|nr:phage tail protein [Verrucomicrobiales bacterium]